MTSLNDFIMFWTDICIDKSVPIALRYFSAAQLLACPSSCDAERAISTLNRIVSALRNKMSWESICMHLIGAEDLCDNDYPYDAVAATWGAVRRRRRQRKVRKVRSRSQDERVRTQ